MELAQAIGAVDPISASLIRAGILPVHIQRNPGRPPGKMKSKRIGARVLQQLLKGRSYLNPRTGEEETHTAASVAIRLQVVMPGVDRRDVGGVGEVGLGIHRESAA